MPVDHPGVVKMQPEQRSETEGHGTTGKLGPARQGEEPGKRACHFSNDSHSAAGMVKVTVLPSLIWVQGFG